MHGDDDQIVPYQDAGVLSAKLLKSATLKIYPGFPHGMLTTKADVINADLERPRRQSAAALSEQRGRRPADRAPEGAVGRSAVFCRVTPDAGY